MKKIILKLTVLVITGMMIFSYIQVQAADITENVFAYPKLTYPIVDTNQTQFFSNDSLIEPPKPGETFWGQDAHYLINPPSYTDNGDGTITDNITGLMWQKDMEEKMSFSEALEYAANCTLGGYDDWRVPTIKELYSLIDFSGRVFGEEATDELFINTDYFSQPIGNTAIGEREIDAQTWSSTEYVGKTMNNTDTVFGVNFVDGRIKGYPKYDPRSGKPKKMYVRLVRDNPEYGKNLFIDNGDGTITDLATGLMWQQEDSKIGLDWEAALKYAENLELAGYDDWRLPNAKELQSIVNYTRSPQTTNSAAIDPIFSITPITDINGKINYPYFWTSTTHMDGKNPYSSAVYIAFGEAQGIMNGKLMDVHGAGAQRSDPKSGDKDEYPISFGPQGDIRYVYNFVRCVRSINESSEINYAPSGKAKEKKSFASAKHKEPFSVITVGSGGPSSINKANACTVIQLNNKYYVLDTGDGSSRNFASFRMPYKNIDGFLFTHLHLDHTSDFSELLTKRWLHGGKELLITGPPNTKELYDYTVYFYNEDLLYRMKRAQSNGIDKTGMFEGVEVRELLGNETFKLGEMTVKTYHLTHTIYNIGYRFEYNGKTIAVTGDTSYDKDLIPLCEDADIVIMDVVLPGANLNSLQEQTTPKSTEKYADTPHARPHMLLNNAIKIAAEAQPKTIVITHLSTNSYNPQAIRQAFIDGGFKGKVIFAEDGLELYP